MFTGLIEAKGTVIAAVPARTAGGPTRLTISAPTLAPRLRKGDSVAVSGVCLTALDITLTQFSADLAEETVRRTHLSALLPGSVVNLELPTPSGAPMGGHVVQGHVDGVGRLISLDPIVASSPAAGTTDWRLRVAIPPDLTRYVVPQGSITLEGISLTVADITGDIVAVAVIPHTYAATALHTLLPGAPINVEVDVLSKYAERQAAATPAHLPAVSAAEVTQESSHSPKEAGWMLTEAYLLENGY